MSIVRRLIREQNKRAAREQKAVTPNPPATPAASKAKVAICTPCDDHVATPYAVSLVQMLMHTWNEQPGNVGSLSLQTYGSSILTFSRNVLAMSALENGATHLLWIDSDMEFAPDTILRLLSHGKPIVGANCTARRPPFFNTARRGEEILSTTLESTGIEQVDRIGFGVVMIAAEVFQALPMPWFDFDWIPDKMVFRGEDFYFFENARKAGYEVWVDHDVSKGVKHFGAFGYSPVLKGLMASEEAPDLSVQPKQGVGGA